MTVCTWYKLQLIINFTLQIMKKLVSLNLVTNRKELHKYVRAFNVS